jgi:predicted ATP-grasp superfamily ATP-dependent carboligase
MYGGAIENRPGLVGRVSRRQPLWGNGPDVLAIVRAPLTVSQILRNAGLRYPEVQHSVPDPVDDTQWLCKPTRSGGGSGIQVWTNDVAAWSPRTHYFQRWIDGEPYSAALLANGKSAQLLGITRQLIGESWLHAAAFHYCGSVGPLRLQGDVRVAIECAGTVLTAASGMRGLFGLDFILCDQEPWIIEVNPRYTASMEIIEFATGIPLVGLHRCAFDASSPPPKPGVPRSCMVGKAILFARKSLTVPISGPWDAELRDRRAVTEIPAFADIPPGGQAVPLAAPVLTCFAEGSTSEKCLGKLREMAADLDRWLYDR